MHISKAQFSAASEAAGIPPAQAQALWSALEQTAPPAKASFTAPNVAYYFGGFLIIGAMTYFMAEGWTRFGGWFVLSASLLYGAGLAALGLKLYREPQTRRPGGILITAAVCLTPLAVYGLEAGLHLWKPGNSNYSDFYVLVSPSWVTMELATLAVSALALRFVRFPLLTLPAAFALWFLSMDCVSAIFRRADWDATRWTAIAFGLAMLAVSIVIDRRSTRDFAFWGYLYGALALYTGLSLLWTDQLHRALFLLIALATIALSVVLGRRVLLVFGSLSVAGYLSQLAFEVFRLSFFFPIALTAIGLAVVAIGIWYQRNESRLRTRLHAALPPGIVALLPVSRAV